jgi:AhpD family alkylhydroperoxidase
MARLPYAQPDTPERQRIAERIIAERGSLLHLYSMLLHSAPVAEGWLNYLTAIRQKCTLPGDLREMVIMRVAHLNGASYEADQHAPIALREGMSERQLAALQTWRDADCFTPTQRAVLAYTDMMTQQVQVTDEVFNAVAALFPDAQMVELTATVAAYNMVSRFLEALRIHSHDKPATK